MEVLANVGFQQRPLDYFYDTQLERGHHIGRLVLTNVVLSCSEPDGNRFCATGNLHLLLWSVGFLVFRLTFNDEGLVRPHDDFRTWLRKMHGLEHDVPLSLGDSRIWSAELAGESLSVRGGSRRFFDLIGIAIHELLRGRRLLPQHFSWLASSVDRALSHNEKLVRKGELRFPNVCTFGSHSEMLWKSARTVPRAPARWIPTLMGSGVEGERMATDVDTSIHGKWWYLSEFQSIFASSDEAPSLHGDVYEPSRASMVEYIAYRRGGLMAIQRETHAITAERRPVEKAKLADWMWLASAVTNDYVLGGWSSTLFERVRQRFLEFEGLRDIFALENQVLKSIDAFQGRLDAESDRMGVVTGVLFGIVAATSLVPVGQLAVQFVFHIPGTYSSFPDKHPWPFLEVTMAMIILVGFVSWILLRRTHSLRPPKESKERRIRSAFH
jgi:hypothetical protein